MTKRKYILRDLIYSHNDTITHYSNIIVHISNDITRKIVIINIRFFKEKYFDQNTKSHSSERRRA